MSFSNYLIYSYPSNEARTTEWLTNKIQSIDENEIVLREQYQSLLDLYIRKLFHQLTDRLEEFILLPQFEKGGELIELYQNFISDFEKKINQLRLAQMIINISRQFEESSATIDFLNQAALKLKETHQQGYVLITTTLGLVQLKEQNLDEVKTILEESKRILDGLTGVDSTVYASYYYLAGRYNKVRGTAADFYSDMIHYLAYSSQDKISYQQQQEIAFDLCLAALIGDTVYNFGELVTHPILNSLRESDKAWIIDLLEAFNSGNIEKYQAAVSQYSAQLNAQESLKKNEQLLKEKIAILAIMELAFKKPSENRVLSFSEISSAVNQPIDMVEILIMKSLSLQLVKGTIDEISQVFHVQWVQPRVLNTDQLVSLKDQLGEWHKKVDEMYNFISEEAPEFHQ